MASLVVCSDGHNLVLSMQRCPWFGHATVVTEMIFFSQQQLMTLVNSFNPVMLIHIFSKFIISASYRILSHMGVALVLVLMVAYRSVDYAVVCFIITYLTETTEYHIKEAAVLTNIREGLSECLRIVAVYISESRLGHIKVIIYSTISFTLGLALLYIPTVKYFDSDPPVIIGILLLAVGKAGLEALLEPFLSLQLKVDEPKTNYDESRARTGESVWKGVWSWVWGFVCEFYPVIVKLEKGYDESQVRSRKSVWKRVWIRAWFLVIMFSPAAVAFLLIFFFEWQKILLIATSLMGIACFLFCCGICVYHRRKLAGVGSGFSVIFCVIKAFVLQRILGHPTSSNHPVDNDKFQLSPKINWLRGLDKVVIISPSTLSQEEQKKSGRICSASQVQLVKLFLSMIPMWTTILVVGLVLSTGNTFFPEQGNNMESSKFSVSLFILKGLSRRMGSYLLSLLIYSKWIPEAKKKMAIQAGISGGIVSSILCSSVAWQVEHRRATIIRIKGLSHKPNETIPMSIFWFSPQFFLLGLTEGLVSSGLNEFTIDQFQDPWREYVSEINEFVIGLGNFLSMFFIQLNNSLLGDALNNGGLDKYYHKLRIVSYGNMLYFFSVIYIVYGSKYQNISGKTSRGLKPGEARRKFFEEVKGLISSLPPTRRESIQRHNSHW